MEPSPEPEIPADDDQEAEAAQESEADAQPAQLVTLEFDGDAALIAEFVTESLEHIENAESALLDLEADPDDQEGVNAVFRGFHTIKGTAGFLGLAHM